jgi:hypothetical protein
MKTLLKLSLVALATTLALSASAQPRFVTKSAGGNSTTGAEVIFRSTPGAQKRIVNVLYQSDKADGSLAFTAGTVAYYTTRTNGASTSVTNCLNLTNGLANSAVLVVEHAGVPYKGTISSYGSNAVEGAFVVLTSGGFGVATTTNDTVYLMGSATTVPVGATTNGLAGYSIYAADFPGRPIRVAMPAATTTNRLNSVTAIDE